MENKSCDTCCKEDGCMFKDATRKAANDIEEITERTNVFLKSNLVCGKWSGKIGNTQKEFGGN